MKGKSIMKKNNQTALYTLSKKEKRKRFVNKLNRYKYLYIMMIPALTAIILFNYLPMFGLTIAFKDYNLMKGVWKSPWADNHGLEYFIKIFKEPYVFQVLKNTLILSFAKLVCNIVAPLTLALFINEVNNKYFKKTVQTISYLPHFLSWVIVAGLINNVFSPSSGIVPTIMKLVTGNETQISLLTDPRYFRVILVLTDVWKNVGWGSILYLASITGIDPSQYEAAIIDGASRVQRMIYITLPSLIPLVITLLIMNCGSILNGGFDQVFNMYNSLVMNVSDILDTYTYRLGLVDLNYGFSSAVGLLKSIVGTFMVLFTNYVSKKVTGENNALWA